MEYRFTKMEGLGNDYIYFNCFENVISNPEEISRKLSDRNFSIGSDGVILVCPSDVADAKMKMYNADGSEGKMCGNGIRCVGKFLLDNNLVEKDRDTLTIETLSGIKTLEIIRNNNDITLFKVDMGKPILDASLIPVLSDEKEVINKELNIIDTKYNVTCVSMGNPHAVIFLDEIGSLDLTDIGPLFENHEMFPERVNTEFVRKINNNLFEMRVWERGSGETLACGTGAAAVGVAAVLNNLASINTDITVRLLGGDLIINYTGDTVYMTGPANKVFDGVIEI